jgi:peroxiredoxin Q/BCP
MDLVVGSAAPPFELPGSGGRTLSLAGLKGRKVVLFFYPKDDTSGCTQEAKEFNECRAEFEATATSLIGISPDSLKSHDKFAAKHGLGLDLGSDESKSVLESYGVWTEKSMYGRKYMGVERTTVLIDADGMVARIWPKVKVPGHAREVLEAARALPTR